MTMGGGHALYVTARWYLQHSRPHGRYSRRGGFSLCRCLLVSAAVPSGRCPPGICNTLIMGASTGLPPSASTLRAGTGALAGPGVCNNLDLTGGALGSATCLL